MSDQIEPGDLISFAKGRIARVESVYTCAADGTPTELEPDHSRYLVYPLIGGHEQPGLELVLTSGNPQLFAKAAELEAAKQLTPRLLVDPPAPVIIFKRELPLTNENSVGQ